MCVEFAPPVRPAVNVWRLLENRLRDQEKNSLQIS